MHVSIFFIPVLLLIVQFIFRKKIINEDAVKISETRGKYLYFWTRIILSLAVVVFSLKVDYSEFSEVKWFVFMSLIIAMVLCIFIEWIYIRESNEHILTLIQLIVIIDYILIFVF